jgi:hypothetical protein
MSLHIQAKKMSNAALFSRLPGGHLSVFQNSAE